MTAATIPYSEEQERDTLGALLVGGDGRPALEALLVDVQLRPEHFLRPRHRAIFAAMVALADRGEPVDVATVWAELERRGEGGEGGEVPKEYLFVLPNVVPSARNFVAYGRVVAEKAYLRRVLAAARTLQHAAVAGDRGAIADAERELALPEDPRHERLTVERRQHDLVAHVERGNVVTWPWPWPSLNELTEIWPGRFTVLGGPTSHGKSVIADQVLDHLVRQGAKVALYLNEMTPLERDLRFVARRAEIPLRRLMHAQLRGDEHRPFATAVQELGYEVVPASGWTALEVARDVSRRGWQFAVLDLLNKLPGSSKTEDIDENVRTLSSAATATGCHILATQHLNRNRVAGAYYPEPSLADLRGSSQIGDLADLVMFVYRREREVERDGDMVATGEPGDDAYVEVAKARMGMLGRVPVTFQGSRMRFLERTDPGSVGRVAA